MSKANKEETYLVKVPVYTSESKTEIDGLFEQVVTYESLIKYVIRKISDNNYSTKKISKNKRNKIQKKEIEKVDFSCHTIGERPCILLKISAYNTNHIDGYVETDQKINLEENHKVGSDNNYILLVPNIVGLDKTMYKYHWMILVYEDPNKDSSEIIGTAKLVLKKMLEISICNIKLPVILDELSKIKTIPELSLNFTSLDFDDNGIDVKYKSYLTESKVKKQKQGKYENMPFESVKEIINDTKNNNEYSTKIIKLCLGDKKEYKITRKLTEDDHERLKEVVEEIYNESFAITSEELKTKLYEHDFIIDKLTPILIKHII